MITVNIPEVSIAAVINDIADMACFCIEQGRPLSDVPSLCLWSVPGIGKSSGAGQIAELITRRTGKRMELRDIRLTTCQPTDLTGIPYSNEAHTETVWLTPELFSESEDRPYGYVFLFDEIDKTSPAVQASALQLILDRKCWTHELPPNSIVIAAGNYKAFGPEKEVKMTVELSNRFTHYFIAPDFESFRSYAVRKHLHPYVLGYLSYDNSKLCVCDPEKEMLSFPTPRSWERVSGLLYMNGDRDIRGIHARIAGTIGSGTAMEFEQWIRVYRSLPPVEKIFRGERPAYPAKHDVLYALISSMTAYAGSREEEITVEELRCACRYAGRFPADFAALFFVNLCEYRKMRQKLLSIQEFEAWRRNNPGYMEME